MNLTGLAMEDSLTNVLGLGPMFRPTPPPLPDIRVTAAVRTFSKSIRTSAYFALNPDPERVYEPKLYQPTGRPVDPDCPALDSALIQYEDVITRALKETADTDRVHNLTKQQRNTFYEVKESMIDGSSDVIPLMADKDSAFVTVTPEQYNQLWKSHLDTEAYTEADQHTIPWEEIRRESVRLAKQALQSELITPEIYRFLTKDCTGDIRYPRGTVMVKTHKPMNRGAALVAASRLYLDTVNYYTTAWAKFLSVKLTPAREQIPNRIKDTADFIVKLQSHRFQADCWLVSADVVEFYPNTKEANGESVIKQFIPSELTDICLKASRLIHRSIYVVTPLGVHKLDGRYGIGLAHSGEICDLDWSCVEQRVLASLPHDAIIIGLPFWGRLVDDYMMVMQGPIPVRMMIIEAFKAADPGRPLKFSVSTESIDFLDVTVYKGDRFHQTGILDTKPYTKPSYTGMHLPYSSYHPRSTFDSILSGYHMRSLITSSDRAVHTQCMNMRVKSFTARGYPLNLLIKWLLQETVRTERRFKEERKKALTAKVKRETVRVIPLKLHYTPRTRALSSKLAVPQLQKSIQKASPALGRASLGRLTLCNLKTQNLLEICRPRGFYVQVGMASNDSQE